MRALRKLPLTIEKPAPQVRGRLPALDGLRGIAITAVVLFHACLWQDGVPLSFARKLVLGFGWTGVQLFFVLSGFLITQSLRNDPSVVRFYRNRALRIVPLYYLTLALLVGGQYLAPGELPAYLLFTQNWLVVARNEWPVPAVSMLWSLAVEEQFYLIWPWVLRLMPKSRLAIVCLVGAAFSAVFRHFWFARGAGESSIYAATSSQLDALLIGAALAGMSLPQRRSATRWGVALGGPALLAWGWFAVNVRGDHPVRWDGGLLVLAIFYGALVSAALSPRGLWARFLSAAGLRWLGRYSYGIYLFHPLIAALGIAYLGRAMRWPELFALSCAAAFLAWHAYEKHFRRFRA